MVTTGQYNWVALIFFGGGAILALAFALAHLLRPLAPRAAERAGFLKRLTVPGDFAHRVVNIHPALIPAFCGHGYYGHHVHEAVLEYGAKLSGCTVHFADNEYDHGPIILQKTVSVLENDTPELFISNSR